MKHLIVLIFLLVSVPCYAGEIDDAVNEIKDKVGWSVSAEYFRVLATFDPDTAYQGGSGFQIDLARKNLFVFLSLEDANIAHGAQSPIVLQMIGVGLGGKKEFKNGIYVLGDVGGYGMLNDGEVYPYCNTAWENLSRYTNNKYAYSSGHVRHWDNYLVEYSWGLGIKTGVGYAYNFTDKLSINFGVKAKWLKMKEHIRGWNKGTLYTERHDYINDRNFSNVVGALKLTWRF